MRGLQLAAVSLTAASIFFAGCQALDQLDTSAAGEGTGIQFTGLIKVLAKYQASSSQKQVAQQRAGKAYVDQALKPAYEKRKAATETTRKAEVAKVDRDYEKKLADAKRKAAAQAELARIEAERKKLTADIEAKAKADLAALSASLIQKSSEATGGTYKPNVAVPAVGSVAPAKLREQSAVLLADAQAYVPRYIAVSVPKGSNPAESRAADSVMFWDTNTQQLAKNDVYVIDRKPGLGKTTTFDDISAEYVGIVR